MSLSVALAVRNEEASIIRCLESVYTWVDEIIVVDGASTDNTVREIEAFDTDHKIAIYHEPHEAMFHKNKQKAIERCTSDWILQLDADEVVSKDLREEILEIINPKSQVLNPKQAQNSNNQNSKHLNHLDFGHLDLFRNSKLEIRNSRSKIAYWIPRLNYFLGRPLKKGGQYPDPTIRLYKNGVAHFPCKSVHEQVEIKREVEESLQHVIASDQRERSNLKGIASSSAGWRTPRNDKSENIGYLTADLLHFPYPTFSDYIKKWKRYNKLEAEVLRKKGQSPTIGLALSYLFIEPVKWFLLTYFRHKGCMDGFAGFVFSLFSSLRYPLIFAYLLKKST